MKTLIKKLKNGTTLIVVPRPNTGLVSCMVGVSIGSNNEKLKENGLAHFFEHLCFKGTSKHPTPRLLLEYMDSIGAQANAFTSNEYTAYHLCGLKQDFSKLFDLTAEIFLESTYPQEEIEKERGVILEEIKMYKDIPRSILQEALMTIVFKGTPMERTVLGPEKNIKNFTRKEFLAFRNKYYHPANTLVVVVGDVLPKDVEKRAQKLFSSLSSKPIDKHPKIISKKSPTTIFINKKVDQAILGIVFKTVPSGHKEEIIYQIIGHILAGSFSSRLFMRLRAEMGLCYFVTASQESCSNVGTMDIATGINIKRVEEVTEAIFQECKLLKEKGVTEKELEKTKKHVYTGLVNSMQTNTSYMINYFTDFAMMDRFENIKEKEKLIKSVTVSDIKRVSKKMFTHNNIKIGLIGKTTKDRARKLEKYTKILK